MNSIKNSFLALVVLMAAGLDARVAVTLARDDVPVEIKGSLLLDPQLVGIATKTPSGVVTASLVVPPATENR